MNTHSLLFILALGAAPLAAQGVDDVATLRADAADSQDRVWFDEPGDDRIWARGATYKASFGAEGFVYIPFLGSGAPQNYPVQFVVRSVRVAGRDLAFAAAVQARRTGMRVTFDRGAVREIYDMSLRSVEQTFVVEAGPGDVEVELEVVTELAEDGAQDGLQFGNALGQVDYGTAYLVRGERKSEIGTAFAGRTLRLHIPAAQRGPGAVVIDPIISTTTTAVGTQTSRNPDIAYDATANRYLVVWEYLYSATDTDIYAELRNANGSPVDGSKVPIDFTTYPHELPRVANLSHWDRFLVVTQRLDRSAAAGRQWTIWGRTRDAAMPIVQSTQFQISDPSHFGDMYDPDVGGDPGTGSAWNVVWNNVRSATSHDVHSRLVHHDTSVRPTTVLIESTVALAGNARISLSNGNGQATVPGWLVAYSYWHTPPDSDIFAAVLGLNGDIVAAGPIDVSDFDDRYPHVSTPTDATAGLPRFLVAYERQGSMIGTVVDTSLAVSVGGTNLTQRFGFVGTYSRVESDGCRFAVMDVHNETARVGTLAIVNGSLALQETVQPFTGRRAAAPFLASQRSGGGDRTDYGIVFTDLTNTPNKVAVATYRGHAPGGFNRRATACGGLGITASGRPFLGDSVRLTLENQGNDFVGLLLGLPAPASAICPGCSIGVDLGGPVINLTNSSTVGLPMPLLPTFVGTTLAVQGYALGSGTCLVATRFSDTIDVTIQ